MNYIKLMRVKHYIKNFLVIAPLFFSRQFLDFALVTKVSIGFILFSLISSIVYILNDLNDIEKDKVHPIKKNRPLASGAVSKKSAILLIFLLITIVCILEILLHNSITSTVILLTYLTLNIAYSLFLKKIPIIDVTVIVLGFILRILYGGAILNIKISNWLLLTVIAISYFLAFGKRRNELKKNGEVSRDVLKHYTVEFLDKMMYLMLGLFIVFYSLWTVSDYTSSSLLIWSVPLVVLIVLKYSLIIENDSFGDPADVVFSDRFLLVLIGIYLVFMISVLY